MSCLILYYVLLYKFNYCMLLYIYIHLYPDKKLIQHNMNLYIMQQNKYSFLYHMQHTFIFFSSSCYTFNISYIQHVFCIHLFNMYVIASLSWTEVKTQSQYIYSIFELSLCFSLHKQNCLVFKF